MLYRRISKVPLYQPIYNVYKMSVAKRHGHTNNQTSHTHTHTHHVACAAVYCSAPMGFGARVPRGTRDDDDDDNYDVTPWPRRCFVVIIIIITVLTVYTIRLCVCIWPDRGLCESLLLIACLARPSGVRALASLCVCVCVLAFGAHN